MEKKSPFLKTVFTLLISLGFATLFMWLALRNLNFDKIKESLFKANYSWVFLSMLFGILAYWFRAIRWNFLLQPLGYRITNKNSLWTISFGYLMNLTIPRSGELARATALYGVEKVPVDQSFGTIITERIVDLLCMLGFLALTIIFKYDAILSFYKNSGIHLNSNLLIISGIVLILLIFLFFKLKNRLKRNPILLKLILFIEGIFQGLTSIFKMKNKGKFILYTLAIWICYYLAAYLICFSLPETSDFNLADGLFIIVVGTLGMMVPASGGIGAFHFALKMGISALFFSMHKNAETGAEVGLSYAFLSHTTQLVIMLAMGLLSIIFLTIEKKKNL